MNAKNVFSLIRPLNPICGDLYHDTATGSNYYFDGKHWVSYNPISSSSLSISHFTDSNGVCRFCDELHCISELRLRPIYMAMEAFINYADFDTEYLIESAIITVDYSKLILTYQVDEILLAEYKFTGERQYYFGSPMGIFNDFNESENGYREVMEAINKFRTDPPEELFKHGIELKFDE